jgi:hypothetical protein
MNFGRRKSYLGTGYFVPWNRELLASIDRQVAQSIPINLQVPRSAAEHLRPLRHLANPLFELKQIVDSAQQIGNIVRRFKAWKARRNGPH